MGVTDLVRRYGVTAFDAGGVHVLSKCRDGTVLATQIGDSTRERLFSFNLPRLESHELTMQASGGLQTRRVGVEAMMDTWGCAKGACQIAPDRMVRPGGGGG